MAMMRGALTILLCSALAACAVALPVPPAKARVMEQTQLGRAAFERGHRDDALQHFTAALTASEAIEFEDGIAQSFLNLAKTYQSLARRDDAAHALETMLSRTDIALPVGLLADAAQRRAALAAQQDDWPTASKWLDLGDRYCANACASFGALLNLRALKAMRQGQSDVALNVAQAARKANADKPIELANSLRLLASVYIQTKQYSLADSVLIEALGTDKQLALSDKLFQDLVLLAQANTARPELAKQYLQRAALIAKASGNALQMDEVNRLLQGL